MIIITINKALYELSATLFSAVQYVKFPFTWEQIQALASGKEDAILLIDHPNYRARVTIEPETRKSLAEDLFDQEANSGERAQVH